MKILNHLNQQAIRLYKRSVYFFAVLFLFFSFRGEAQINFNSFQLQNADLAGPTSIQFGPDNKLYVAEQKGKIKVITVERTATGYNASNVETILSVKKIPNHYDDGTLKPYNENINYRLVTGLYVGGTANNPVIYVNSSDDQFGAGSHGDVNLCTNSGILSKLYKENGEWKKIDLVRGLPRSEENHATNGIEYDSERNQLLISVGGFTNSGGVSRLWTYITEYALSAAIISVDLTAIEAMPVKVDPAFPDHPYKYDLPTLDDPTRENRADGEDINDPFGGNDGMNQAKIVEGGPIQIWAPGFRNAYDLVITKTPGKEKRVYVVDNGPNGNWGGYPVNEGPPSNNSSSVTNQYDPDEPGSTRDDGTNGVVANFDGIEYVGNLDSYVPGTHYGGHPNPIRANPSGAGLYTDDDNGNKGWRNSAGVAGLPLPADWPPVPLSKANPIEGDYQEPGVLDPSFITFNVSTNGITEYTASNFNGALKGDLLVATFNGKVYRVKLTSDGRNTTNSIDVNKNKLNGDAPFATLGGSNSKALDLTTQGDDDIFPGSVWVADWGTNKIYAFEPDDNSATCLGTNDPNIDEDNDGYNNRDEIESGTDPCNGAERPADYDNDGISDRMDHDDDNDGIDDIYDKFQIDPDNGDTTRIPTHYALFNNDPGTGFYGLGFSGLMINNSDDYLSMFDENNLVAGGAVGAFTIYNVPGGDARTNNQQYAFQFGVNSSLSNSHYMVTGQLLAPFFNENPQSGQSQGIFIGTGDQDNYAKVALTADGILILIENNGEIVREETIGIGSMPTSTLTLYFEVDPILKTVQPFYKKDQQTITSLTDPIAVTGSLASSLQGIFALGPIASSGTPEKPFDATWDYFLVDNGRITTSLVSSKKVKNHVKCKAVPNPFNDNVVLQINSDQQRKYIVKVMDNKGVEFKQMAYVFSPGKSEIDLNLGEMPAGLYYVQVNSTDNLYSETIKVIKK